MAQIEQGGFVSNWGHFPAEGFVLRPAVRLYASGGRRVIAKIKTQDFART